MKPPLTSWTRIEPDSRDQTLNEGLQARIADPLWLLARQRAFGELAGQDAAIPVQARLRARVSQITRLRPGPSDQAISGRQLTANSHPLERLVEADTATPADVGPLQAAKAGLHYLRMLADSTGTGDLTTYTKGLLAAYPFPAKDPEAATAAVKRPSADPASKQLRAFVGRVPDANTLYPALHAAVAHGALPASPPHGAADPTRLLAVARQWCAWYEAVHLDGAGAPATWNPPRLEHGFSIAAPGPDGEQVLSAGEYASGNLDWHDFDLGGSSLAAKPTDLPGGETELVHTILPSPIRYRGMPAARFWEFEDASVDFGDISAPPEEVTTSLIVEFALRYGNDHFLFPLPLAIGSVCHIDSLVVSDTFGQTTLIRPISQVDQDGGTFRLFEHSTQEDPAARSPLFVLFPTIAGALTGPALEEIHLLRDQLADVVWAVEQTAIGPDGAPVDRTTPARHVPAPPATATRADLIYRLRSELPGNWFALLPPESGPATTLALALVPGLDNAPAYAPWSEILAELEHSQTGSEGGLRNEEVTRAGARATRAWRYARWIDGSQLTWAARRAGAGRAPGSSGLRFDETVHPTQTTPPPAAGGGQPTKTT